MRNALTRAATMLRRARRAGTRDTAQRVVNRLYRRFDVGQLEFPLLPGDVADSARITPVVERRPREAGPARIGWLCSPPSAGSGGHTTLFRMVAELESRGHECVLFLYDRHGGDIARHTEVIRRTWPNLAAEVVDVTTDRSPFDGVDAVVATGWPSAHVLASSAGGARARRLYFVQDYEPFFYPLGSLYALAEDSYRFGFRTIALGRMVAEHLATDLGVPSEFVEFGCDTDVYTLTNRGPRSGIVFYEKPDNDRRGYLLARLALEEFHSRHPEVPIHLYGDTGAPWSIPVVHHGKVSPAALNELYNGAVAGLAMSFTNLTLVAEEMLAAGVVPIINDSSAPRAGISHPEVAWAHPTPGGIADALAAVVEAPDIAERAVRAATGIRSGWGATASRVADIVLDEVAGVPAAAEEPAAVS